MHMYKSYTGKKQISENNTQRIQQDVIHIEASDLAKQLHDLHKQ